MRDKEEEEHASEEHFNKFFAVVGPCALSLIRHMLGYLLLKANYIKGTLKTEK